MNFRRILEVVTKFNFNAFFQKLGWNQLRLQMLLQVSKIVEFINPNVFQMLQASESSPSSMPVRLSLQSIVTSPADESDTRFITQMVV